MHRAGRPPGSGLARSLESEGFLYSTSRPDDWLRASIRHMRDQ